MHLNTLTTFMVIQPGWGNFIGLINHQMELQSTHWFVDCHFEALSFSIFLETEVAIFGKEGDAEGESPDARQS